MADQQYKIDTDRAGKQWATLTPAEQQAYGNDPSRYATAMTGYSLGQGLGEKSAAEKMKSGLPALEASKDVASNNESIARSLFGTDKWNNARSIGLAEKENNADLYRAIVAPTLADASADEARVSSALNKGRLGNNYVPLTLRNEGLQQGLVPDTIAGQRRGIQSLLNTADSGDHAAIAANNLSISDNENALATAGKRYELTNLHTNDSINKARLSGQLSSANLSDVDTLKNTQQFLNRKENFLSRLIGHPDDPYLKFVQLNGDVTDTKSPFKNLKIAEEQAKMESVMGSTGETTKAAHDANGNAVPIPSLKEQAGVIHPNMEKPIAEIPAATSNRKSSRSGKSTQSSKTEPVKSSNIIKNEKIAPSYEIINKLLTGTPVEKMATATTLMAKKGKEMENIRNAARVILPILGIGNTSLTNIR